MTSRKVTIEDSNGNSLLELSDSDVAKIFIDGKLVWKEED